MIPKLIQNIIISILLNGIEEERPTLCTTLKEYVETVKYYDLGLRDLTFFKKVNFGRYIVEYSLVCKDWFNFISQSQCSRLYCTMIDSYDDYKYNYDKDDLLEISDPYSLYRFESVTTLYLDCGNASKECEENERNTIIEWISRFTSLERLVISTDNSIMIQKMLDRFTTIKMEVYIKEVSDMDHTEEGVDLSKVDSHVLEFVHLHAWNPYFETEYSDINYFAKYYGQWRVNSINFNYDGLHYGVHDGLPHLTYQSLFNIKSVNKYVIRNDHVDSSELVSILHPSNSHITSFKCSVPFAIYCVDDQAEPVEDHLQTCSCISYRNIRQIIRGNRLDHWIEFCLALSNNTSLKHLHLENKCNGCKDPDGHNMNQKTKESFTTALISALTTNSTLTSLSVPCQVLSESFFQSMGTISQSITYLQVTQCDFNHIKSIKSLFKHNKNIRHLSICGDFYDSVFREYYKTSKTLSTEQEEDLRKNKYDSVNKIMGAMKKENHGLDRFDLSCEFTNDLVTFMTYYDNEGTQTVSIEYDFNNNLPFYIFK
ncbi:hypothetical protein PPL_02333 [Heterostelium album PN500]|uniref:Uncharacterized protein n=1 Tax=Heterostelium pallidum (strain ATCC 26659 / Pp 5 / PN500) TaxID=670386 RepID=D3B207_HETP5|nr:hypothetical protein PPL_02333 [Heterostelium album PN500]EFA85331.1 hypothetical protein PPL_02333 [Heterostelium album PN500]|eukprot:XP_020437440.1 hypothetical protein PPL_02333 [Heterostelium album PN500]